MKFNKLALASAIALAPTLASAAMVEIEDEVLSGMTGQDGIEVVIDGNAITGDVYIHDKDGLTGTVQSTFTFDGAIVIDNFSFDAGVGGLTLNIDAGDSSAAGATPTLNIGVVIPSGTVIQTGAISVANSQRDDGSPGWLINTNSGTILSNMSITLGATTMNIQLGNEPQGNMVAINTVMTGGLSIANFALNDANSGGGIRASNITMLDTGGGANLSVNVGVDVTGAGLVLDINALGTSAGGMDIRITDQYLGSTTSGIIGDITVVGLNMAGTTITISGK